MSRSVSEVIRRRLAGAAFLSVAALSAPAAAQDADAVEAGAQAEAVQAEAVQAEAVQADAIPAGAIASSEIAVSENSATLELELTDGRRVRMGIENGRVRLDGRTIGNAQSGSAFERAWRALLDRAIDAPALELSQMLIEWEAPEGPLAGRFDQTLEASLTGSFANLPAAQAPAAPGVPPSPDTVDRLLERIQELEQVRPRRRVVVERDGDFGWLGPFRHIAHGIAGLLSLLIGYGVLFGIAFITIFFGGRRYIEGVADTARHATMRSLFVGLAGSFLVIPAFILGMLALAISIIGIPALLVWVPLFPIATGLAVLLGYLAVAHAAGEAMAERRFYAADWFQRGNSYYFLLTGLGLLVALFLASMVVFMAGPWLRPISGILLFLGCVSTIAFVTIGFGAVLISRGGKQPIRADGTTAEQDLFTEEAGV